MLFRSYSPLKGYIRGLIKHLRYIRKNIEKLKNENPDFDADNSMNVDMEKSMTIKLRAAWEQLDQLKIIMIMRIIRWNEKQKLLGTPEKIKRHYERLEWSFKEQLLNKARIFNENSISH